MATKLEWCLFVCLFFFVEKVTKKKVLLLTTIIERTEAKNSPQGAITITRTHISIVLHAKKLMTDQTHEQLHLWNHRK